MLGYTFLDQKTDDDGISAGQGYSIGLTGAYNFKLGDNTKGFIQPMVGYGRDGVTPEGGDEAPRPSCSSAARPVCASASSSG